MMWQIIALILKKHLKWNTEIYSAYARVFILPEHFINEIAAQYYVMNVIVRREHAEFIAEILYDYLFKNYDNRGG